MCYRRATTPGRTDRARSCRCGRARCRGVQQDDPPAGGRQDRLTVGGVAPRVLGCEVGELLGRAAGSGHHSSGPGSSSVVRLNSTSCRRGRSRRSGHPGRTGSSSAGPARRRRTRAPCRCRCARHPCRPSPRSASRASSGDQTVHARLRPSSGMSSSRSTVPSGPRIAVPIRPSASTRDDGDVVAGTRPTAAALFPGHRHLGLRAPVGPEMWVLRNVWLLSSKRENRSRPVRVGSPGSAVGLCVAEGEGLSDPVRGVVPPDAV